jgi:hypothetical protein
LEFTDPVVARRSRSITFLGKQKSFSPDRESHRGARDISFARWYRRLLDETATPFDPSRIGCVLLGLRNYLEILAFGRRHASDVAGAFADIFVRAKMEPSSSKSRAFLSSGIVGLHTHENNPARQPFLNPPKFGADLPGRQPSGFLRASISLKRGCMCFLKTELCRR